MSLFYSYALLITLNVSPLAPEVITAKTVYTNMEPDTVRESTDLEKAMGTLGIDVNILRNPFGQIISLLEYQTCAACIHWRTLLPQ